MRDFTAANLPDDIDVSLVPTSSTQGQPSPRKRPIKQPILSGLAIGLALISALPAEAIPGQLGVVKSRDNVQNWAEITNRLQSANLTYCVLEAEDWNDNTDLNSLSVLLMPNLANIDGLQAASLQQWINQGGRAIVTGPTGTLAQPEVKEQLKSLLGAYWGFSNSLPATLRPLEGKPTWNNRDQLSTTFIGGVVVPTGIESQAEAVWLAEGTPPAVVVSDNVSFLGWRWGVDKVAPAQLDSAWLQASLDHFGVRPTAIPSAFGNTGRNCDAVDKIDDTAPILPNLKNLPGKQANQKPDSKISSSAGVKQVSYPQPNGLSSTQISQMNQELLELLARFESTLLAADASNRAISLPQTTTEVAAGDRNQVPVPQLSSNHRRAYAAAREARQGLQQFRQYVNQGQYTEARQRWLKARRTLWDNYPTEHTFNQPEVRSIWLDRGTIVRAKSEKDLAIIFDRIARSGINTVFFETINASYPIYPSRIAPEQNPLTRGWDPLKAAVKLAHERGMELHAWVWVFAAANQGHNDVLNQPKNYLGPVLSRNPDWLMTDRKGNAFDWGSRYRKAFYDPANPEVRRYLLAMIEEIASNYDIDGIQFDYIRYPFQNPRIDQTSGYSPSARALFKDFTGKDPIDIKPGDPLWSQWTGFRTKQVDSFVATASSRLKQRHPDLIITAAVFPLEKRDRFFRLQQNWEEWIDRGWVDAIVLMTYALDTDNLEERVQPLTNPSLRSSSLLLPGIRLLKVPDPVTMDQLQFVRNLPANGFALFAAENLTPNLEAIFNRAQGKQAIAKSKVSPLRQPFPAAAGRYQAMQQEWNFLYARQQLKLSSGAMNSWINQSNVVSAAFNRLATQPSTKNLNQAREALNKLRRQFPQWMQQQQRIQPYQVQVWQNRLTALNHLLNYGERVTLKEKRF